MALGSPGDGPRLSGTQSRRRGHTATRSRDHTATRSRDHTVTRPRGHTVTQPHTRRHSRTHCHTHGHAYGHAHGHTVDGQPATVALPHSHGRASFDLVRSAAPAILLVRGQPRLPSAPTCPRAVGDLGRAERVEGLEREQQPDAVPLGRCDHLMTSHAARGSY